MRLHALRAAQSLWRKSITLSDSSGGMPGWTSEDGTRGEVTSTMMAMAWVSGQHSIAEDWGDESGLTGLGMKVRFAQKQGVHFLE